MLTDSYGSIHPIIGLFARWLGFAFFWCWAALWPWMANNLFRFAPTPTAPPPESTPGNDIQLLVAQHSHGRIFVKTLKKSQEDAF